MAGAEGEVEEGEGLEAAPYVTCFPPRHSPRALGIQLKLHVVAQVAAQVLRRSNHFFEASQEAYLMGLRMDDLHTPSVAAGPTSTSNDEQDGLSLRELVAEKDRVEAELKALGSVLASVCLMQDRRSIRCAD